MIKVTQTDREYYELSPEGKLMADTGSHEAKVFNAIPPAGLLISELAARVGDAAAFGQAKAFKNKWIKKEGATLVRLVEAIVDQTQLDLKQIEQHGTLDNEAAMKDLKKRQLVVKKWGFIRLFCD